MYMYSMSYKCKTHLNICAHFTTTVWWGRIIYLLIDVWNKSYLLPLFTVIVKSIASIVCDIFLNITGNMKSLADCTIHNTVYAHMRKSIISKYAYKIMMHRTSSKQILHCVEEKVLLLQTAAKKNRVCALLTNI